MNYSIGVSVAVPGFFNVTLIAPAEAGRFILELGGRVAAGGAGRPPMREGAADKGAGMV